MVDDDDDEGRKQQAKQARPPGLFPFTCLVEILFCFLSTRIRTHAHTHAHYAKGRRTKKRLNSCGIIVQSLNQKQRCQLRFSSLRFDSSSSSSSSSSSPMDILLGTV